MKWCAEGQVVKGQEKMGWIDGWMMKITWGLIRKEGGWKAHMEQRKSGMGRSTRKETSEERTRKAEEREQGGRKMDDLFIFNRASCHPGARYSQTDR